MNLYYLDFNNIDKYLKKYYLNKRTIKAKQEHIEELKRRLEMVNIEYNNIDKTFVLKTDLKSVTYDNITVKGGYVLGSSIDRQIENIFLRLENEKNNLSNKILETSVLIWQLQADNDCFDEVFYLLDEESNIIMEMRYNRKYSYEKISYELSISVSSVYKKIKFIKNWLIKWFRYYNNKKK